MGGNEKGKTSLKTHYQIKKSIKCSAKVVQETHLRNPVEKEREIGRQRNGKFACACPVARL